MFPTLLVLNSGCFDVRTWQSPQTQFYEIMNRKLLCVFKKSERNTPDPYIFFISSYLNNI